MGYHGVGELVFLDQTIMARANVETLDQNLLTSVENTFGGRQYQFIFQRNNTPGPCPFHWVMDTLRAPCGPASPQAEIW